MTKVSCAIILFCFFSGILVPEVGVAKDVLKTPYGAEFKGNKDGSIPSWQGGLENKKDFGGHLIDEEPLYVIDASNISEYKAIVPKALQALISQYPKTMKVPVFPTYRPGYYPQWIYDAIEKNKGSAKLINNGDSVIDAYPGIPFPDPVNGYHVLWNHLLSYKGVYIKAGFWERVIQKDRKSTLIKSNVTFSADYYDRNRGKSSEDQMFIYYLSSVASPSRLSGSFLLVHERVNASIIPRQAWGYMAGQRRVVRIPSVDYDAPMPRSEGIRFADEIDIYNGSVDRYAWRLLGKKELIIPYNNQRLYEGSQDFDALEEELLTPFHLNPGLLRYEKHRVWVIEGTLKEGKSHPYKKRVLYLDEDSWVAVLAENYDRNNRLWRVSASYVRFYHELPAVFKVVDVFHDLREQSYYAQGGLNTEGKAAIVKNEVAPKRTFKPSVLRRLGRR